MNETFEATESELAQADLVENSQFNESGGELSESDFLLAISEE